MDYVQRLRAAGVVRLFPSLKKGKNTFAEATGKWYARLLKKVGLTDKTLVLHGLRHTGITRLANVGVNDKIRRVLVGHAGQDVHDRIYNYGVPLLLLQEELEKLQYPEVCQALKIKTHTDKAA
jgi:integrase